MLSHTDKDFDNIKMIICKNKTKRDRMEIELIWKHKPLYNKNTYENIKMIEDGFVNIETIRSALK